MVQVSNILSDGPHKPVKRPRTSNFSASTLQAPECLLHRDGTLKCPPAWQGTDDIPTWGGHMMAVLDFKDPSL